MRKFELVRDDAMMYDVDKETLKKPYRATKHAVCYDCFSPIDVEIPAESTKLVFINFKAYCNTDEGYILASTSGLGKRGIILANGIGIIESDYYGNENNDGNLGFMLHNLSKDEVHINVGDKIGQGFFIKILRVDDEEEVQSVRKGGFGSTDKQ